MVRKLTASAKKAKMLKLQQENKEVVVDEDSASEEELLSEDEFVIIDDNELQSDDNDMKNMSNDSAFDGAQNLESVTNEASGDGDQKTKKNQAKLAKQIFVSNLPVSIDKTMIVELFSKFGKVEKVYLKNTKPRPITTATKSKKKSLANANNVIAHVTFKEKNSAVDALKLNASEVMGRYLRVNSLNGAKFCGKSSVAVSNLTPNVSEEQIRKLFADCGPIVSARVVRNPETGVGKGFAFVNFERADSVESAKNKSGLKLLGRQINVVSKRKWSETMNSQVTSDHVAASTVSKPKRSAKTVKASIVRPAKKVMKVIKVMKVKSTSEKKQKKRGSYNLTTAKL